MMWRACRICHTPVKVEHMHPSAVRCEKHEGIPHPADVELEPEPEPEPAEPGSGSASGSARPILNLSLSPSPLSPRLSLEPRKRATRKAKG